MKKIFAILTALALFLAAGCTFAAADEIDVRSEAIPASYLHHWTEGPQVIKRDGRYFLTDTGNHV